MSVKYRIVYDRYSRYNKSASLGRLKPYLLPLLLCAVCIFYLFCSSNSSELFKLILPGNPTVTMDAFQQLSADLDNGETIAHALNVFCERIMNVR